MKFTVLWSPYSESKLARLWIQAADRRLISEAADKLDEQLGRNAESVGESRSGDRRIVHESPLGIIFSVNDQDCIVLVLDVWRF
jgi:mRNA-degrading endonuclease RelE of RelBE toxin-antitoxin system